MIAAPRHAPETETTSPFPRLTTSESPPANYTASWAGLDVNIPLSSEPSSLIQTRELAFELELVDGEYVAMDPQTGVYGEGDTEEGAIISLFSSLESQRQELRSHAGKLSPELKADLAYLERILWR